MQRPVGGRVGEVQEERILGLVLVVLLNRSDRMLGNRIGVVEVRGQSLLLHVGLVPHEGARLVEATRTFQRAEYVVESATGRPGPIGILHVAGEMPLPREVRAIAGWPERLSEGDTVS